MESMRLEQPTFSGAPGHPMHFGLKFRAINGMPMNAMSDSTENKRPYAFSRLEKS